MKTIINILFNLFSVLYFFQRIKNNDKDCQIGILIDLIVISESIVVIVLGSIDVENFSELFNDSKYECLKDAKNNYKWEFYLNIAIITLIVLYAILSFCFSMAFLIEDCKSNDCIELDFIFKWHAICECLGKCCEICSINCS